MLSKNQSYPADMQVFFILFLFFWKLHQCDTKYTEYIVGMEVMVVPAAQSVELCHI